MTPDKRPCPHCGGDHAPCYAVHPSRTKAARAIIKDKAWPACATRCDRCDRRRLTYQTKSDAHHDRMCAECLFDVIREEVTT